MKQIKFIFLTIFLFLTSICFAQDIEINRLSNSLRDKGFEIKVMSDPELGYTYYDFTKVDGQYEIFATVTLTEEGQVKKIGIRSTHKHLKPNLASVKLNFSKIENPFVNTITNKELKEIFKNVILNFPETYTGEKFEVSIYKTKNSIDINISEKLPEFDWEKYKVSEENN